MGHIRTIILTLCILLGHTGASQAQRPTEYQVKAAFLYNFAKFVEWPAGSSGHSEMPYIIGVLGKDPFGRILDETLKEETVKGRDLRIVRLKSLDSDLKSCHILFISATEQNRMETILELLADTSVLTVGETDGFCEAGGILNFVLDENRVRFEINPGASERAGLKMSSRLLKLATRLIQDQNGQEAP